MLMVGVDQVAVESDLIEGRLACPYCEGELRPWWFARARKLRDGEDDLRIRPRRAICHGCRTTHVLLPVAGLLRRRDLAEVIGRALVTWVAGTGHRAIAGSLGIPPTTVRGWLRRLAERAEPLRAHFTRLAFWLDPSLGPVVPRASPEADALEAIVLAAQGAVRRFGPAPVWWFASGATGGRLLANTSSPFPAPW
jgi:hypothetical protein